MRRSPYWRVCAPVERDELTPCVRPEPPRATPRTRTARAEGSSSNASATGFSSTMLYMSSQPIRIESRTLDALRDRSAQTGEPIVRLAQRYIDEGMRLDRHPGIVFRDGPAGRRPVVVGGPDVWEVIAAARSAPERGDELVDALAERVGPRRRRSGSRSATTPSTRTRSTAGSRWSTRRPSGSSRRSSASESSSSEAPPRRDVPASRRGPAPRARPRRRLRPRPGLPPARGRSGPGGLRRRSRRGARARH